MAKTISMTGSPPDIDGHIVDGNESLRQRIHSVFHFRLGEWFLNTNLGVDYDVFLRYHVSLGQVAQFFVSLIKEEGGKEIIKITNVEYENQKTTRRFVFSCRVHTIHGEIEITEEI